MALSISEIKEMYETAVQRMFPRWKEMLLCYDMLAGRQYSDKEKQYHEDWNIAMRTFNMLHSSMVTFDGVAIGNIPRGKAWPVEPGDAQIADVLTEVLQDAMRQAKAEYELQRVLTDAGITGWGGLHIGMRRSELHKDGDASLVRVNMFDVLMDLDDENPSIRHDMWRGISRWGMPSFFSNSWGQYDPSIAERIDAAAIAKLGSPEEVEKYKRTFYGSLKRVVSNVGKLVQKVRGVESDYDPDGRMRDWVDSSAGMFRGVELYYRTDTVRKAIADPMQSEPIPIPEEYQDFESNEESMFTLTNALAQLGGLDPNEVIIDVPYTEWRVCGAIPGLIEDEVLFDVPHTVQGHGCPLKVLEAFDYDPRKSERMSLIKLAIDSQRRLNRSMSLVEEMQKRRMYPDWLVPKGAIAVEDMPTWKSSAMGRLLEYSVEAAMMAGAVPTRLEAPGVEGLIMQDFSLNMDLIPRLMGVPSALGGEKDSRKDGADLYQSMVAQGQTMVKPLLHKFEQFFKETAEFTLAMIQRHYTAPRFIRLTGKNGIVDAEGGFYINDWDYQQGRPVNDLDVGRHDIVIDTTHLSPVERQTKFMERMQMQAMFDPILRDFSFPELLELSGWGDAPDLLRKWRIMIQMKYAPYGQIILQMLESDEAYFNTMQNGDQSQTMMNEIAMMLQAMGGNELAGMRESMNMRQQLGDGTQQPGPQGAQNLLEAASTMVPGNYPGGM